MATWRWWGVFILLEVFCRGWADPYQALQGQRAALQQLVAPSPREMLKEELDKDRQPNLKLDLKITKRDQPALADWEKNIDKSDQWIVATTNKKPTKALKTLVDQPGWRVVVVATEATPKDWDLKGCIFLSMEKQKELGFSVNKFLSPNSFTRKMVGYLFALRHGAKVIYDTDDNSEVLMDSTDLVHISKTFFMDAGARVRDGTLVYKPTMKQPKGRKERVFTRNVNGHFGQPNTWPRGFPLQDIGVGVYTSNYTTAGKDVRAYIQMAMANGDPDLDSIFRLTRKEVSRPISFQFDPKAPPIVLPPGVVAPFSAESTLFHKEAFFTLALPPNKNDLIPAVWRSYVAQRMIKEIGGQVAFLPPIVYQSSRVRDLEADYNSEHTIFYKTGALLEFLDEWKSPEGDILERFLALVSDLAREGFYTKADAQLTEAFLNDLVAIGYSPMKVISDLSSLSISGKDAQFKPHNLQSTFAVPPVPSAICSKILLIVIFSSEEEYAGIERQRKLYGKMFHMVFYGPKDDKDKQVVGFEHTDGVFHHRAVVHAIKANMEKGYNGYLFMSGDALLNYPHVLSVMDPTKVWAVRMKKVEGVAIASPPSQDWGHPKHGIQLLKASLKKIPREFTQRMRKAFGRARSVLKSKSDIGYIPQRFSTQFVKLASVLDVTYEIAIPTALRLLSANQRDVLQFPHACYYLKGDEKSFSVKPFHTIVRPVKYTGPHDKSLDKFQAWAEDRFVDICS